MKRTDFMVAKPSLLALIPIVLLAGALTLATGPAFPDSPQSREETLGRIVWLANHGTMADSGALEEKLRDEDPAVREYAERALWAIWSRSGDADIDRLMARGVEEMQAGNHKAAIATFSQVVKRKPDFAEGWNKRATVYYLAGDFKRSIADCSQVLKRNPRHFGALSGLGQIYYRLDDWEKSIEYFRKALEVNPNMAGVELNIKALESMAKERKGKTI